MTNAEAQYHRKERAAGRFDEQANTEQTEARRLSRLREQENRRKDRLRKFHDRHGVDPCYVFGCTQPAADEGLCSRNHLSRLTSAPFVDGQALHAVVREWADRWERLHPLNPDGLTDSDLDARAALIERVSRVPKGSAVTASAIESVLDGKRTRVEFYELADPIACAIGQPFLFSPITGSIQVQGADQFTIEEEAA